MTCSRTAKQRAPLLWLLRIFLRNGVGTKQVTGIGKLREVHALWTTWCLGQMLPDFFAGETQDGRQQTGHGFTDAPDRSLR